MPVNPNEAPEGFEAVSPPDGAGCSDCVFDLLSDRTCSAFKCEPWERKDGMSVFFVLRTNKPATANFPHDDMGTPV